MSKERMVQAEEVKNLALLFLWLLATAAAVAVASAGVNIVSDEVIEPAPAAMTAPVISQPATEESGAATPPPDAAAPATTTTTIDSVTDSTTTTISELVTTTTTSPSPSTTITTTTALTTTAPPPPTTTAIAPSSLTFQLIGGSTSIAFAPEAVTVIWATPNAGFDVKIEDEGDGMKVEFRSETHRSRVDVWWADGPRHEIREESENG